MAFAYTIAGSEATGGAGFQVDLKTFHQLGCYGLGALTCIVSFDPENNWNHRFVPVDAQVIADQIEAATSAHDLDLPAGALVALDGSPARTTAFVGLSTLDTPTRAFALHLPATTLRTAASCPAGSASRPWPPPCVPWIRHRPCWRRR